jgi:two-component system phosphate regulon sensor histidine kinase PhoR
MVDVMFRRKLIWQLYPSFLIVTLLALLAATAYSSYTLRNFYLDQLKEELRLVADVATLQVEGTLHDGTPADIDVLCKELARAGNGQMRLTVIASDGKVLGDSHHNPALMENHSNRAEIIDAMREGLGRSVRFSPTLGKNMMYVAVPVR